MQRFACQLRVQSWSVEYLNYRQLRQFGGWLSWVKCHVRHGLATGRPKFQETQVRVSREWKNYSPFLLFVECFVLKGRQELPKLASKKLGKRWQSVRLVQVRN